MQGKLIFLIGSPRSGSTLLMRMLAIPRIAGPIGRRPPFLPALDPLCPGFLVLPRRRHADILGHPRSVRPVVPIAMR